MVVFTLPGYDVVFKVIRDRFGPTKTVDARTGEGNATGSSSSTTGRGASSTSRSTSTSQFATGRFAPTSSRSCSRSAAETVEVRTGTTSSSGTSTRSAASTPLNLFLREAPPEQVARTPSSTSARRSATSRRRTSFPGDLLVKNFGVTRHGRVVFYDYDELCAVTDCDFRELPPASGDDGGDGPSFYVGPRDVFPEEFLTFMGFPKPLRALFAEAHPDLVRPEFWNEMKRRHSAGEVLDVFPYPPERRLGRG